MNRLCTQVADRYGWGFVNINLRSYYAEGAKTMGFEIVEQLGWRYPKHLVSPVAGGTLLPRIVRGLRELREIGLVDGELPRVYAAQAAGCAPVVHALEAGLEHPEPVRPNTIAKSIAIGNPADGYQVIQMREDDRRRRRGRQPTKQIVDAIQLLAETEGIFTEPAGGTTLAATIDLIERGVIPRDESIVVCVTGNGYKTAEVVAGSAHRSRCDLSRAFKDFEGVVGAQLARAALLRVRVLAVELDTIASLNSIGLPLRSTFTVAVVPIFASATSRRELRRVVDRLTVEADDHVAGPEARFVGLGRARSCATPARRFVSGRARLPRRAAASASRCRR